MRLLLLFILSTLFVDFQTNTWEKLEPGLEIYKFKSSHKSVFGDQMITVVSVDPKYFTASIQSAKELDTELKTADEWALDAKQNVVVNAGMFNLYDGKTNMGYMKIKDYLNNGNLNKDNTILAMNPLVNGLPTVQIIDRTCQDWGVLKNQYETFTQSIRMVDCHQTNRWAQQNKQWSTVAIAVDKYGKVLLCFTRSPQTAHNFIDDLLKAPIDLYNCMYLEGGPDASLFVQSGKTKIELMGSYETDFNENDDNKHFWNIPNVICFARKK